jgi:transcriptional regulator with XRE-family HTH domain
MIGKTIKELRNKHNLSQRQLAEKLEISKHTLIKYEYDQHEPSFKTLIKIAEIFNVSPNYLFGYSNDKMEQIDKIMRDNDIYFTDEKLAMAKAVLDVVFTDSLEPMNLRINKAVYLNKR